jgi:predicted MFS family arabinose efflux permease
MTKKIPVNLRVWAILACAWAAIAASQIITFGYGMMMPRIMEEFSLDTAAMGKIAGIASWCQVASLIPVSLLLAKTSPKYALPLVMFIIAAGQFIFGRAAGVPMLYLGRIMFALFAHSIATLLVGVKLRGVPPEHMTQVNGVENFVQPIGQTIATLVMAPLLLFLGSWRGVYTMVAIIILAALILFFTLWGSGARISFGQGEVPAAGAAQAAQASIFSALKEAWSSRVVWITGLAWPGTTIVWLAMFYYWPTYAVRNLGLELSQAGVVLSMIPVFSAIASLTSPRLAKKIGYDKPLICIWGFLLPVFYYLMTVLTSVPLLCVCSALAGYGAYCFVPLAFTNVYKIGLSKPAVTIATGTILSLVSTGGAIAGTVIGALTATLGLRRALAAACLTPLWFGVLTLFLPELGHKKTQELKKT